MTKITIEDLMQEMEDAAEQAQNALDDDRASALTYGEALGRMVDAWSELSEWLEIDDAGVL